MLRNVTLTCALMAMALGIAQADHHMEGEHPPMAPEVILGPPDDFHPPEEDPPPEMPADPAEAEAMVLEHFFMFMDADGSGAIDMEEFLAWVRGVHMPEMMEPPHDPDMEFDPDPMGGEGDEGEMDGLLREGDGDLADLNLAPECSDELRDSEQSPQATNHPCEDLEGNLIFRTICNMPGYDWVAISLPTDRAAGCFGLEALRGEIGFEIVSEDGSVHVFDTTMGKEAYMDLKIDGPSVYHIKSTGGSPDGAVTLRFVDVSTAGM